MAVADGRGQKISQQTGVLTVHTIVPCVPVVIRFGCSCTASGGRRYHPGLQDAAGAAQH